LIQKRYELKAIPGLTLSRILLIFFVPAPLWLMDRNIVSWIACLALLIGEIIDRCEFYLLLNIPTPKK
jgi:hypothetical protein